MEKFTYYSRGYEPPSTPVFVMRDKEGRDHAKASKKKKRSKKPKTDDVNASPNASDTHAKEASKTQNLPSKNKAKNLANKATKELGKMQISSGKSKSKAKSSSRFNSLIHKHSTGATNWQKFLAEGAEGVKKKAPTVKNTSIEHRQKSGARMGPSRKRGDPELTKIVGMDCEMVGVGEDMRDSMLARVSIVNGYGDCIYDKYVKPREEVTDYRTFVSGIREEDIANGEDFEVVQREVAEILRSRILVGHALKNDLTALFLKHPFKDIRDTAKFFRKGGGRTPSLKSLAAEYLNVTIQEGEHSSVQDAQAAVQLYNRYRKLWELGGGNRNLNRLDLIHNKIRPPVILAEDT